MDHFSAKINQVVIESTGKRKTFTRSFIANPPYDLEKRRGKLFGLIEIESDKPKVLDLINFIISEFKACYYSPDLTGEEPQDIDSIFEDSLKDINLSVVSFLESEQIILDLEKVNIILGIMSGKKIHFTHVGNLNIFLFQYLKKSQY